MFVVPKVKKLSNSEEFIEKVLGYDCIGNNRRFTGTIDKSIWYTVNHSSATMYVPPTNVLRVNMIELDRFLGAVQSFYTQPLDAPLFDWWHLKLSQYGGEEVALGLQRITERIAMLPEGSIIAADIETRNLSWDDNKLLAIGFAVAEDECIALYNIPEWLYPALNTLLQNPHVKWGWHGGKFDCEHLQYMCGIHARVDEDSMLKHYAQISEMKGTHKLKSLGPIYLQAPQWDDELNALKSKYCREHVPKLLLADFTYDMIPMEILVPYMQRDCIATYRLLKLFDTLKEDGTDFIYYKLCEASNVFAKLECNGIMVDQDQIAKLEVEYRGELQQADQMVAKAVDYFWNPMAYSSATGAKFTQKFSIKSPKQLKWLLETATGLQLPNTRADTIDELVTKVETGELQVSEHTQDLFKGIAKSRKASKYLDTYVLGMQKAVCKDGRVRGTYNLHGTETGRLSSSNPNMQNIPKLKDVKNIFVAHEGYKLIQLDYSQAELRVMGVLANDPFLIDAYRRGADLHAEVARKIFGDDFTKLQRDMAKTVNFG